MSFTIGTLDYSNGNETILCGFFIEIHRDLRMRKALLATFYSDEFNTMALN